MTSGSKSNNFRRNPGQTRLGGIPTLRYKGAKWRDGLIYRTLGRSEVVSDEEGAEAEKRLSFAADSRL